MLNACGTYRRRRQRNFAPAYSTQQPYAIYIYIQNSHQLTLILFTHTEKALVRWWPDDAREHNGGLFTKPSVAFLH